MLKLISQRTALVAAFLCVTAQAAPQLPTQAFFADPQYRTVRISPDGRHLAVVTPGPDGREMLAFVDLTTRKLAGSARFTGSNTVVDYFGWVSNERVIISTASKYDGYDDPLLTGNLYGVNFDGSDFKALVGPEIKTEKLATAAATKRDGATFHGFLHGLPDNARQALIWSKPATGADWSIRWAIPVAQVLDVRSGRTVQQVRGPAQGGDLFVDRTGAVRFATGFDDTLSRRVLYARVDDQWRDISRVLTTLGDDFDVVGVGGPGRGLFATGDAAGSRALYEVSDTGEARVLASRPGADVVGWDWSADETRIVAVSYSGGDQGRVFLEPEEQRAKELRMLGRSFEGQQLDFADSTPDGQLSVVFTSDDRNSGDYYLFDSRTRKAEYLFSRRPDLDPELMARMQPVSFTARDGLEIHGFLTTPVGKPAKALPLVVLVHGGPHQPGTEDRWGFDGQVQFLANRGYAVLQVNFRGSPGRGPEFVAAGYKRWGAAMQDDLTDATRWAIAQGVADTQRICIAGGSYGGYAALMGVVREPDLYKCAFGYVGVYDLPLMFGQGDVPESRWGVSYLKLALGTDQADLAARSPVNHVARIKAALFLAHGGRDDRAHPEHYHRLKRALDKAGKPYESLWQANEGHGFREIGNVVELNDKLAAFLAKHIGT